jgi:DNA polymerase-1
MNWQNQPNHDDRARRLKRCIVPKLDALIFADYMAMEFRIFGYYCAAQPTIKDFSIVNEFKRDEDPYTNTGKMILGREPTKEERNTYKRATLSLLYNGSWRTILNQGLAKTEDEAQDIVDELHKARPQIAKLTMCVQRVMKDRGYVTTLWGRQSAGRTHAKKTGKFIAPERRPMVNYLIQGSASDIMKDAILNIADFLDRGLYDSHNVLTIHDEIGLDCAEGEIPSIVENLPRLMSNARVAEYLPLGVDIEIARTSWADTEPYVLPEPVLAGVEDKLPWED